ncbi:MAG: hypothetical protein GX130_09075 [Candidatus Hydrogenedens sp.]|jgi:hypothetical protein|nr:hypothetical protein [Candidatus Hydrogenedens sp.]
MNERRLQGQHFIAMGTLLVLSLILPLPAQALEVEEVLQAFRDSYGWLDNVAMKIEWESESLSPDKWKKSVSDKDMENTQIRSLYETSHIKTDFFWSQEKGWHDIGEHYYMDQLTGRVARNTEGRPDRWSFNNGHFKEAGDFYVDYQFDEGDISWLSAEVYTDIMAFRGGAGALLEGRNVSFSLKRLTDLLTPDNVAISEETLDGEASCFIEAQCDYGHIELWLSPEHNYAMQQVILTKEFRKDLDWRGEKIYREDYQGTVVAKNIYATRIRKWSQMDGYFVPLVIEEQWLVSLDDEIEAKSQSTTKLSKIRLNPDFDALKAFQLDIYNDTYIDITDRETGDRCRVTWEDDKPVFKSDNKELAERAELFLETLTVRKVSTFTKMKRWTKRAGSKIGSFVSSMRRH